MDGSQITEPTSHGFKYFAEVMVGALITAWISAQAWLTATQISQGRKIAKLEAAQITRADFDLWREEQQVQLDELRGFTERSNADCVRAVERSQDKLETALMNGINRVEGTNRELLVALAKNGLAGG